MRAPRWSPEGDPKAVPWCAHSLFRALGRAVTLPRACRRDVAQPIGGSDRRRRGFQSPRRRAQRRGRAPAGEARAALAAMLRSAVAYPAVVRGARRSTERRGRAGRRRRGDSAHAAGRRFRGPADGRLLPCGLFDACRPLEFRARTASHYCVSVWKVLVLRGRCLEALAATSTVPLVPVPLRNRTWLPLPLRATHFRSKGPHLRPGAEV